MSYKCINSGLREATRKGYVLSEKAFVLERTDKLGQLDTRTQGIRAILFFLCRRRRDTGSLCRTTAVRFIGGVGKVSQSVINTWWRCSDLASIKKKLPGTQFYIFGTSF